MLTTIDLPVISHVTHATEQEPLLGLMLSKRSANDTLAAPIAVW
jgi:hypothetical protein